MRKKEGGEEAMKKLEEYEGKDRIVGRPVRLNKQELKVKEGKDYAELVFFGDWHYGARECANEKAVRMLDYCLKKKIYVLLMGDLIEAGTRYSVGAGVYQQKLNPQQQMEYVVEKLKPLADAGLILGSIAGNHEARIEKETGIDVGKVVARLLGIRYLGYACWNLFKVGKQNYSVYALHGSSGSRFVYTKLKALVDISHSFDADLIAMGHVHEISSTSQNVQKIDMRSKTITERKKFLLLTGHYLKYDQSYAQAKGMPIAKMGSPKVKLFADKWDIHISA